MTFRKPCPTGIPESVPDQRALARSRSTSAQGARRTARADDVYRDQFEALPYRLGIDI
jgi:hypothetical protein